MKRRSIVRLEPPNILFPNTFISTTSRFTFNVTNLSDQRINYSIRCFSTKEEEQKVTLSHDTDTSEGRTEVAHMLNFYSDFFSFEPSSAELWPQRHQNVIASFTPTEPVKYNITCYLYIHETGDRVPVTLTGLGVPPCAQFNVTSINTGPVALESVLEYQIFLQNTGEVPVSFSLIKKVIEGIEFNFTPESGIIPVKNKVPITITFIANQVRTFNETFTFQISGTSVYHPTVTLFGRVIGPVFALSTKSIDFGRVSLGTINTKTFILENKSLIPFDFNLRAAHDGTFAHREISIAPSGGFIDKFCKQIISIEFIPTSEKELSAELYLDIAKFGDKLRIIPITATIVEPRLRIEEPEPDLGLVYIGHKIKHVFTIINEYDLMAYFSFEPCNDETQLNGEYDFFQRTGCVPANTRIEFPFFFTPKVLGQFSINGSMKLTGSDTYVQFSLHGISAGPNLIVTPENIDLGKIKVLHDVKKVINIENRSPIPANFTVEIDSQFRVFSIDKMQGVIEPNSSENFDFITNLDDSRTFTCNVIFKVEYLYPIVIPVRANGTGVPVVASIPMDQIILGPMLTEHMFIKPFSIENRGMRRCSINFSIQRPKIIGCMAEDFFAVVKPTNIEMEPGETINFEYKVRCPHPSEFITFFQCHATLGNHRIVMYTPKIIGSFMNPKISFSHSTIEFTHLHDFLKEEELCGHKDDKISPSKELLPSQIRELTVTNHLPIPVNVSAAVQLPFILSQTDFRLLPNTPINFTVTFDPKTIKTDFLSEHILKHIVFCHGIHSIKFNINAISDIYFPNIDFQPNGPIDFGLMLINTERSIEVKMKNANTIDTFWEWELLPNGKKDVAKIFDIYPIRGEMKEGDSDVVHFSFVAKADENGKGTQHNATAVCHIRGGPDYQILLNGSSSNIDFRVDPVAINFGNKHYLATSQEIITLTNLSDAAISYETIVPRGCQFKQISITPANGKLQPDTTTELTLSILPGLPKNYKEHIIVRVARIQDIEIPLTINARFEQVELSIPRFETDAALLCFNEKVNDANKKQLTTPSTADSELSEALLREIEIKNFLAKLTEHKALMVPVMKKKKKNEEPVYEYKGYVNSRYKVDMGRIVFGDKRSIEFSVKNVTSFPLTGKIIAIPLENTGFKIEPLEFEELGVENSVTFVASFDNDNKTLDFVGDVSFEVPLLFADDFGIMIHLVASTEMPALKLSQQSFDFGNVIIGQYLSMIVQLQNMNPVQVNFQFGNPENLSEKEPSKPLKTVFTSNPSNGNLPSQTFQNIEIAFAPTEPIQYKFNVPIIIPHNKNPTLLQISGTGVKITLTFDPPVLNMPSILPFSEPSNVEVTLHNNSSYPIEVFSYQFDLINYVNERLAGMGLPLFRANPISTSRTTHDSSSNVSKFSLCVIVHGAPLSGKTSVSKIISHHLDNAPILSLKNIWNDLQEENHLRLFQERKKALKEKNEEEEEDIQYAPPTDADFVELFSEAISEPSCTNGFVLDGLDFFPEPEETEQFLGQCLKHRGALDEITKNPFQPFPHAKMTSWERALSYVLASFDGHYVFLVSLKCTEEEINNRILNRENDEKKRKREKSQKKRDDLINMSETQYDLLDEKAQEEADKRRKATRDRIIKAAQEAIEEEENAKKQTRGRSGRGSSRRKPTSSSSNKNTGNKTGDDKTAIDKRKPPQKSKYGVPVDPVQFSILEFNFTLGTIVEKLLNGGDSFQVVDPNVLLRDKACDSTTIIPTIEQPNDILQQMNSLLVNGTEPLDSIILHINNFLPSLQQMKERAFTRLIPKPKSGITDYIFPKKAQIDKKPEVFAIITEDIVAELNLLEPQMQNSSARRSGGRSSRRQRQRKDPLGLNEMIPFIDELDLSKYTPRWNIDPNSSKTISVQFSSLRVGKFIDTLNFGIPNCKFDVYKLKINGNCVYPEINREIPKLFSSVVNKFTPKVAYSWVKKLEAFHCGYLSITNTTTSKSPSKAQQQQSPYKFQVTLKNESEFQTDIICNFSETTKSWIVDQPNLSIKPQESSQVTVMIHPTVAETMNTTLQVLIKDNPNPLLLPLIAEGTQPMVEVTPNLLDFERCMLKQDKSLDITLTNNGKIPCDWALKHNTHLGPNITFSETSGSIQPKESSIISITFQSPKPLQFKKNFQIEVFGDNKTKAFSTHTISIQAEAYDTHFDVVYPKGLNHVNFGLLKISQIKTLPIILKNRSKYPVQYSIGTQGILATTALKIDQPEGTVAPGEKTTTVNITYQVNRILKIDNKKMMTLRVNDPVTNTITNTIPLLVSAETVVNKFTVNPQSIDLGDIPVQTQIQRQFTIKNDGSFPFNFDITARIDPNEITSERRGRGRGRGRAKATGRGGTPTRSQTSLSRGRGNKKLGPAIDIGHFILQPSIGTVQPGQVQTVNVDFNQPTAETFKANAVIKLSDSPDDHPFDLELYAKTFIPGLSNSDYEQIFKGQHLCLRSDVTKKNMNAFLEDEHIFHFAPLILHDRSTVPVYLRNPFPIPCIVDVIVKPRTKAGMSTFPFEVSEKTVNIPPKGEYVINLSFTPSVCENFIGFFEANVKGGTVADTKTLKFCVEGAGALPGLTLINQLDKPKNGLYSVTMGRVLLNTTREKTVSIRNDAFIPANVKVTTRNPSKEPNTEFSLKDPDFFEEPILLETGRTINITVKFSPEKSHRASFEVIVSCADNPKSDISFNFSGEGYIDDVVFDGSIEDDNDVLFKDNVVGRQQQCTFRMRNICSSDVRFCWGQTHDFQFSPRIGHLRSGQSKQITVTLFTDKPVKYNLFKVPCQWTKIELEDSKSPDWDDSMKTTEFIPRCDLLPEQQIAIMQQQQQQQQSLGSSRSSAGRSLSPKPKQPIQRMPSKTVVSSPSKGKDLAAALEQIRQQGDDKTPVKVVKIMPEPLFKPLNTKLKDLILRIYAISDVIKYSIDTTEIPFAPTMMFQSRVYDVKVTNTSQIKFEYQWEPEKTVSLRNPSMPTPFSVTPATGVLAGGQVKVFKVHFSPQEVDDFTATFKMSIPYLSVMDPPLISMSGLSRRPLCHFNVEMSDYISAGRRHPAYSDPLPDDIKVVELFSKGVGKKTIKKFEVINPTSAPYEVTWTRVNKGTAPSVQCLVPQALVSSGKRYPVGFTYLPTSVKTVESLWLFSIHEHNINIHFLIVGRIMPQ